jgi:hypothetical protein
MKKIKLTEEQFLELVDKDGSIVSGNIKNTDSEIKTNMYPTDKNTPETTDDFAAATGQDSKWYWNYGGLSYTESVVKEDIYDINSEEEKDDIDSKIPSISNLATGYGQNKLDSDLREVMKGLTQLGVNENELKDIKAIVLKELLQVINFNTLHDTHKSEIKKIINDG